MINLLKELSVEELKKLMILLSQLSEKEKLTLEKHVVSEYQRRSIRL